METVPLRVATGRRIATRERIIENVLALFNERGAGKTTTAEIAAATGITEGNLHYHFRKKEQMVAVVFDRLEAAVLAMIRQPIDHPDDPESYITYHSAWLDLMWRFRCCYRDGMTMLAMAPHLGERLQALHRQARQRVAEVFDLMTEHGLMRGSAEEHERLLANVWIVSSYWMSDLLVRTGEATIRPEHIEWARGQIRSLFAPYLTRKGSVLAGPDAALEGEGA